MQNYSWETKYKNKEEKWMSRKKKGRRNVLQNKRKKLGNSKTEEE